MGLKLKYIHTVHAHGRIYHFFRCGKFRRRLPDPDAPDFGEEYARCMRTVAKVATKKTPHRDTLAWLIAQYQAAPEWKRLADRTRRDYASLLQPIAAEHGAKGYRQANRAAIIKYIRDPLAETPRRADQAVVALASVYKWAISRDLVERNPCHGIGKLYRPGEGFRAWTPAEIERFATVCTDWEWLVFSLAVYTAQRPGDLVRLTWFAYDGERFTIRQGKTKQPLVVEAHPELRTLLDALPRTSGTIITRPNGAPYASTGQLANRWSAAMRRHGLPGCTIHGLRTTSATLLAEAGASDRQLMAATGHRTMAMVQHYTRAAEQKRLNSASVAMLPTWERKRS